LRLFLLIEANPLSLFVPLVVLCTIERTMSKLSVIRETKGRIKLLFHYDAELISLVKSFPYYFYDTANHWWTLPDTETIRGKLHDFCRFHGWEYEEEDKLAQKTVKPRISPDQVINYRQCPDNYLEKLEVLRYSPNTIKTYSDLFREFLNYYPSRKSEEITEKEIIGYMRYLVNERGVSTSYQNQAVNAIKFYYEKVLGGNRRTYYIDRPKREKTLSDVLSEEEITSILKGTANLKHRAMLMLSYSVGLRVGELLQLRPVDLDSDRMQVHVREAKGKKDRFTLLSTKALGVLREYFKQYKPKEYLFEGINGGVYSERSIHQVLKQACQRAGIKKHVSMHTLRHTFATQRNRFAVHPEFTWPC